MESKGSFGQDVARPESEARLNQMNSARWSVRRNIGFVLVTFFAFWVALLAVLYRLLVV